MERQKRISAIVLGLILIGSVWGLFEIVGGAAMRSAGIPHKGDVLTATGIGLMAVAFAIYRKPVMLIAIAALAASMRQMAIPILHLSTFCKANSCLAVLLGGTTVAGLTRLGASRLRKGYLGRVAIGFSSGFITATSFYFIGMHVAPCRYLLSFNRPGGFVAFIGAEALIWAALSAVTFPLGYHIGERLSQHVAKIDVRQALRYQAISLTIASLCWIAGAIAIAKGL